MGGEQREREGEEGQREIPCLNLGIISRLPFILTVGTELCREIFVIVNHTHTNARAIGAKK